MCAQYFNGRLLIQPQASVYVDNSRLANLNPTAANTMAILAVASAGTPKTGILITDPEQARRVFRSGDLLDAINLAFAPSSQTGGATRIYAVRVNSAVKASATVTVGGSAAAGQTYTATINGQAVTYVATGGDTNNTIAAGLTSAINNSTSAVVNDALNGVSATVNGAIVTITAKYAGVDGNAITLVSSASGSGSATASGATLAGGTGNTLAVLTSDDYGLYTNQIYFATAAGSVTGAKLTIGLTTVGNVIGGTIVKDNLARNLFSIQYTGAGSACQLTVTDSSLTTNCVGASADNLSIPFGTYTTIQAVVDAISATGKYTVSLSAASSGIFTSASQFDGKLNLDIKTGAQTLTANVQAVIDAINSSDNIFTSAVRQVNPASNTIPVTNNNYLVGGSDGTSNTQDWTDGLAALQTVDAQVIVPITENATIHASALTHCQYMSTTGRMPRVAIVGGALNEYSKTAAVPTQTITNRTAALNNSRIVLVSPGLTYTDAYGVSQSKSAAFMAAMVGGVLAALPAGTPATHKYLSNISALEVNFSPADLDALLVGGVCPIQYVTNKGYRIVQSKTTWLGAPNFAMNEISTQLAIDAVSRRIQDALDDQLVGQKVSPVTLAQAVSITETVLKQAKIDGLIVGDDNSPAFQNISARSDGGDAIRVSCEMSPAIPSNYVLVSVSAVPYTGQVSSTS